MEKELEEGPEVLIPKEAEQKILEMAMEPLFATEGFKEGMMRVMKGPG